MSTLDERPKRYYRLIVCLIILTVILAYWTYGVFFHPFVPPAPDFTL